MKKERQNCLVTLLLLFMLFPLGVYAQQIQVKGRVIDEALKEGIPGANITVKGTGTGTVTDVDGNYSLTVDKNATLVFSFIGYVEQSVPVNGRQVINVTLKDDTQALDEIVVIAYGTKSKATITGALSSIENKELVKSPAASVTNVLAGSVPGISAVQSSGQPGKDAAQIYVRGSGSLNESAGSPLILVDGIERDFSQLDPNEIESISVLKDASSTAVFGVRGANGVILVTTRRGSSGKPSINVSLSMGLQQPSNVIKQVGSYEYAKFYNYRADINGYTSKFSDLAIEAYRTGSDPIYRPSVIWSDYLFKNAFLQSKNNVNISGGTDNVKYFISLGYLYQDGILKSFNTLPYDNNYKYNRYNYRANLDFSLTKTTTMKLGVGGYIGITQSPNSTQEYTWGDVTWTAIQAWSTPFSGPGVINGIRTIVPSSSLPDVELRDGLQFVYGQGYQQQYDTQLNMDIDITQKLDFITPGLSFSLKGAYDNNFMLLKERTGGAVEYQTAWHKTALEDSSIPETSLSYDKTIVYVPGGSATPLTYSEEYDRDRNWYLEARFNYDRTFNTDHKVGALLLYNQSRDYYPTLTDGSGDLADYWYIPRGYIGFVGRATYSYQSKYMVDVNVGYNGSENFAPGSGRYGLFPSVSAGWVLTAEKFMEKQKVFDYLKLRASYGVVGSDVGMETRFMYKQGAWSSSGSYSFGIDNTTSSEGYAYGTPGNTAVTWETAKKQNYGLDAKFLDSRLSLTFDYFFEHRTGILISPNSYPGIIATSLPNMNLGIVDNHGYEISLGWNDKIRDFNYYVNANVSFARNKIIYMDEVENEYSYQNETGHSTDRNSGLWRFVRLYQESDFIVNDSGETVLNPNLPQPDATMVTIAPGDCMFEDLNGDGVIDDNDKGYAGYSSRPEYTFGLNAGFSWKGLSFSMQWTGATNVNKLMEADYVVPFTNAGNRGLLKHLYDGCWTPTKTDADYPRPANNTWNFATDNGPTSTLWLRDASYLRLKSLNVGYTFSGQPFLKKLGISSLSLTFSGYNLLTFSPLKLIDPEGNTTNNGGYPLVKLYSFGLNLSF
ncbi:MAG: TonB-dependent receptor [Bacteroides sp.]|nr:TonB-dependent receptor [Bacteroides sp.]